MIKAIQTLDLDNGNCKVFSDKNNYAPSAAALINGTLAHSLDFDDTHAEASLHSSAPILSAALSAAQMKNCSGQQLITACVIGYEIQIRLGLAGGSSAHYKKGFHPTATCGVFGAVASAGYLMGLTKDQFVSAFGIALSQSAGSMQFLTDGAWTKRSHVGQAAQNGLNCATMAAEGFKGPTQAFEGQWGYLHAYASGGDLKKALDGFIDSTQTSVNGKVKIRLHKGNAIVIGRSSENNSLYREDLATYSKDDIFNHEQAEGFIYMWGMSNKIWAELNSKKE